jgi:hypothetical protein
MSLFFVADGILVHGSYVWNTARRFKMAPSKNQSSYYAVLCANTFLHLPELSAPVTRDCGDLRRTLYVLTDYGIVGLQMWARNAYRKPEISVIG